MVELALNPSETRAIPRKVAGKRILRPILLAALGAGALAGVAMAASSVIVDLVATPVRGPALLRRPASVQSGIASQWPDLKDGLPAVVGVTVKSVTAPGRATAPEPARMAALPDPATAIPTFPAKASASPSRAEAPTPRKVSPSERIPVPTEIAIQPAPAPTRLVMSTRTAALLPPRETIRAQDETPRPVGEAAPIPPPAKAPAPEARVQADLSKPHQEAARTREAAAKPPAARPAPATAATSAPDKTKRVATAHKAVPAAADGAKPGAAKPTVVANAGEPEEVNILGVKVPSLAPAGRTITEGITTLRDAVKSVF